MKDIAEIQKLQLLSFFQVLRHENQKKINLTVYINNIILIWKPILLNLYKNKMCKFIFVCPHPHQTS